MQNTQINVCIERFAFDHKIVFNNFNLSIRPQKITGILGESGCGKSTLLRIIARLDSIRPMLNRCDNKITIKLYNNIPIEHQLAYVSQSDLLLPWISILDNLIIGFKLRNTNKKNLNLQKNKALALLKELNLEYTANQLPEQLSQGMKQRIAIIRAVIEDQPIVLMDEPFSSLDTITRLQLQNFTLKLMKQKTVVLVTHDPLEALRMCDVIHVINGKTKNIALTIEMGSEAPRDVNNVELQQRHHQLLTKIIEISSVKL